MDSYRSVIDGIWFCCGPARFVPAGTSPQPAQSLGLILWVVAVVRHSPNRSGNGRVSVLSLAPSSTHTRVESGRALPSRPSPDVVIALLHALVGLAMVIYLLFVHGSENLLPENGQETAMTPATSKGIVDIPSNHSVAQTVEKLQNILRSKGVKLFALIDHSGEAEKVGMNMRPTKLLIFGNPKAGTPLMLAAPGSAIDLPLKILIWEDGQGKVWVSYNSPVFLEERHGLPRELLQNIAVVESLATKAAE